jgi:hypothetical protein
MLLGEAKRKAPAQAELRPTWAGASHVNRPSPPIPFCDLHHLCAMFCPLRLVLAQTPLSPIEFLAANPTPPP